MIPRTAFSDALQPNKADGLLVLSLIPLGDALVVLTNGGRKSAAFGIHGATAVAMIIAALLLERS